ncbi:MAG: hypothetical protein LBR05_01865 [Azoarcus sp.]|jgi:type II secretory pathway component PulM|nr:hypothetical protein [Azoarcus sp.]
MKLNIYAQRVARFWWHFSAAERHQLVGAACFLIALCYGLLIWYPANKQLGELIYKEQKQAVRNRTSMQANAALKDFNFDGLDIEATRKELEQARASLSTLEAERNRLVARFLPLEDLESLQALKTELTRLAASGDMEITALEHIYQRAEDRERAPTLELLKSAAASNPYKRPLLRLKARASYRGLMEFLDGLTRLSRIAAPVWSDVSVRAEDEAARAANVIGNPGAPRQWLEVEIRLAI